MARRGFFAELHHGLQVAAREHERAQRAAVRQHNAAVRIAEQARKAADHAERRLASATEAERKRLEKESREAYVYGMEAEAEEQNRKLAETYEEIDSLLSATLKIDDYVDLNALRVVVPHVPFERPELETSVPAPKRIADPVQPIFVAPEPPKGLASLFGKKKHADAVARAEQAHQQAILAWDAKCNQNRALHRAAVTEHARAEANRLAALAAERSQYAAECAAREADAAERNRQLDELIANLSYGTVDAVKEYVSIVLANSVYPEHFAVKHEFEFEPSTAELTLKVLVPGPDKIPEIKAYKYTKSADEITATPLPQKACRDRYESAVHQVALRSIHEVFEADRRGIIATISLEVGTQAVDPATGRTTYMPFVVVGAERASFIAFDLSAVIPARTLERLGASISKNPYALIATETSGVRRL